MGSQEGTKEVLRRCIEVSTDKLEELIERRDLINKSISAIEQSLAENRTKLRGIEDNDERP